MEEQPATPLDPARGMGWVLAGMILLLIVGLVVAARVRIETSPPPPEVARDPLLVLGREQFLRRCASCHGLNGHGNGPLARNLMGPPPGNLSDANWKYGDQPAQVLNVLRNGAPNSAMPAWKDSLTKEQLRAVAAYVYYLAKRDVPAQLREPAG